MTAEKKPDAETASLPEPGYLTGVLTDQDSYRAAPVAMLPRLSRALSAPMGFITKRVIPSEAIEAALKGADWAASASIRTAAISHDFNSLEACDDAVAEVRAGHLAMRSLVAVPRGRSARWGWHSMFPQRLPWR